MRFDDRLLTVLNQPAEDRHDAAVRWRQLVDLVARAGANGDSPVIVEALQAIRSEAHRVDEPLRAAAARAVAALPLPFGLLEYFASDSLAVSAPVLAAVSLDDDKWRSLHSVADEETRRFIETLQPAIGAEPHVEQPSASTLASPASEPAALPIGEPDQPRPYTPPSLHEVVERIERRRQLRAAQPMPVAAMSAPVESPALFRWECGPSGEIAWVEGAPRGPLIGRSIARSQEGPADRVDQEVARAFALRAPFRDASMSVGSGGAVSGEWKISGVPAFEPADGRFAGYRGVALRETPAAEAAPADSVPEVLADPDSLRELVHEIKTPLNAIIGFAEIIEGQYLGPADRGYRDRAAEIVRQARLLLTGIDDLDFAAKVHSAKGANPERVDLAALVEGEAAELRAVAAGRNIDVDISRPRFNVAAAVQPELADRLFARLFTALIQLADAGERLAINVELASDGARIAMTRPMSLRGVSDAELFGSALADGGTFSLRLVKGLARIAGGDLVSGRDNFMLLFRRA